MAIEVTRLRYVIAQDEVTAEAFINGLPFKVELKSFTRPSRGSGVVLWFVLPEMPGTKLASVDLRRNRAD